MNTEIGQQTITQYYTQPDTSKPLPVELVLQNVNGRVSNNTKVLLNGMDITHWVSDLSFAAGVDRVSSLSLELINVEVNYAP